MKFHCGVLDVPFTRKIRDELLREGLAERHRWLPDSGWTTFRIRSAGDVKHGLWLLRLSHLRYMLREDPDSILCIDERRGLHLSPELASLLEKTVSHHIHDPHERSHGSSLSGR